jgi:hypothetical protein
MRSCAARVRFGWVIGFVKKDICINRCAERITAREMENKNCNQYNCIIWQSAIILYRNFAASK